MILTEKIMQVLTDGCMIRDEEMLKIYAMKRKEEILTNHINNVCKIYEPKGTSKYFRTILNPNTKEQKTLYGKSREEVEEKLLVFYLNIQDENNQTVGEILELMCAEKKEKTGQRNKDYFNNNISALKNIKFSKLTEEDIINALTPLINEDNPVKKKAFDGVATCLNNIQRYCKKHKIKCIDIKSVINEFKDDYCTAKRLFKPIEKDVLKIVFTEAENNALVRYAYNHPTFKNLAIAFLLVTGLRVSELLGLKAEDIHIKEKYAYICRMEDIKTEHIIENCKDNSVRSIHLDSNAIKIAEKIFELRDKLDNPNEFFILNPDAKYRKMHYNPIDRHIRKMQRILDFDNKAIRSSHDCRRTYASIKYLKIKKNALVAIQKQLGHTTPAQTWEYIKDIVDSNERAEILETGCIL